jgi:hypothetical protein
MLQWLYTYALSVCFKYFCYFRRMLQVFYLDVTYVAVIIHIFLKRIFQLFHLFQTYIATSSSYCKCFVEANAGGGSPAAAGGLHVRARSEAGVGDPHGAVRHAAAGPSEQVGWQASKQAGERSRATDGQA